MMQLICKLRLPVPGARVLSSKAISVSGFFYRKGMRNFLRKKRKLFPSSILEKYRARLLSLRKDQVLFHEGDHAVDYFQVEEGSVKMFIASPDGQEFIQGIFAAGESFGEPALVGKFPYPGSAKAIEPSKVWKLPGDQFIQMLRDNFDLHLKWTQVLCQRLRYKSMVLSEISSHDPDHRILTLLKYYKSKNARPGDNKQIVIPCSVMRSRAT